MSPTRGRLEAESYRLGPRSVTTFWIGEGREVLTFVTWTKFAASDDLHRPYLFSMGGNTLRLSLSNSEAEWRKSRPWLQRTSFEWLRGRSRDAAALFEEAFVVSHRAWHQPFSRDVLGSYALYTLEPLQVLGFFFDQRPMTGPPDDIRLDPRSPDDLPASPASPPLKVASRSVEPFTAAVLGARDEPLGRLQLWRLPGEAVSSLGPLALELRVGARLERLVVLEFALPDGTSAGEFSAVLVRETGASRQVPVQISSIEGKGADGWCEPWLLTDDTQAQVLPFEIPPGGEIARRRARRAVLETITKLLRASAGPPEEADRTLWRWSQLLAQPEVQAVGGPFEAVARILSEVAPPRFASEAESAWLGSVRLRKDEGPR